MRSLRPLNLPRARCLQLLAQHIAVRPASSGAGVRDASFVWLVARDVKRSAQTWDDTPTAETLLIE